MKHFLRFLVIAASAALLTSCHKSSSQSIVGLWKVTSSTVSRGVKNHELPEEYYADEYFDFKQDGSFHNYSSSSSYQGSYHFDNETGKLILLAKSATTVDIQWTQKNEFDLIMYDVYVSFDGFDYPAEVYIRHLRRID